MLLDRAGALTSLIVSDFAADAQQIAKPKDKALPTEPTTQSGQPMTIEGRTTAEGLGLSSANARQIAAMRKAGDGDEAYKLGQGLPDAVRLYTAGAVDFNLMGNGPCHPVSASDQDLAQENAGLEAELAAAEAASSASAAASPASAASEPATAEPGSVIDEAADPTFKRMEQRFEAVLKLPASARKSRAAWAAFSLGRAHVEQCHTAEALRYFQTTRQLIRDGADDPLYLGVASLGEEARVQWAAHQAGPAVALYAEQAGRGSRSGVNSLRRVAEQLLIHPDQLQPWLNDPLVQRVVVRYALSQADLASFEAREQRKPAPPSAGKKKDKAAPAAPLSTGAAVLHLLDALTAQPGAQPGTQASIKVSEPDALAAVAYAVGRDDQALKLASVAATPLSEWVLAKLALRSGSNKAAADHYAAAVKLLQKTDAKTDTGALPAGSSFTTESGPEGSLDQVLRSEQGFMSLSRGDFVQALAQLYSVGNVYWLDLAYVAERVVTTSELKAFVDANVPQPPLPKLRRVGDEDYADAEPGAAWPATSAAAQLRALLARRLMRDGLYAEAYDYFPAPGDKRFGDPDARQHAREFVAATQSARKAWTKLGRAQELFAAATLMREHGMDIVGYELGPDSTAVNGWTEVGTPEPAPERYATLAERERFKASAAKPERRYHYRVQAAELAAQAAQTLPPRSQAYAASLCHATGWLMSVNDNAGARALYQQYVKNGPAVEWATHFGHDCPEPDFEAARMLSARQQLHELRLWARHHKPLVYGGGVLGLCAITALALRVRRIRQRKQPPQLHGPA